MKTGWNIWRVGALGCGITALLLILGSGWIAYKIARNPEMQGFVAESLQCRKQLTDIHAALGRYEAINREYPNDLSDLVPEYLADSIIFHCPAAPGSLEEVSYKYIRPDEGTPDDSIVLRCEHHSLPNGEGLSLCVRKDGRFANQKKNR